MPVVARPTWAAVSEVTYVSKYCQPSAALPSTTNSQRSPQTLLEYAQLIVSRMLDDEDVNARRAYHFIAPLFVFTSILLSIIFLSRLAFIQTCIADIPRFRSQLALVIFFALAVIWLGLVILQWLVKKVAIGARMFVEYDFGTLNREAGVPRSYELVFGGVL